MPAYKLDAPPNEGNPEWFVQNGYTAYEMKPEQDPDANRQLDVYAGVTAARFSSTNTGEGTAGPWTRCISTAQCLFFSLSAGRLCQGAGTAIGTENTAKTNV